MYFSSVMNSYTAQTTRFGKQLTRPQPPVYARRGFLKTAVAATFLPMADNVFFPTRAVKAQERPLVEVKSGDGDSFVKLQRVGKTLGEYFPAIHALGHKGKDVEICLLDNELTADAVENIFSASRTNGPMHALQMAAVGKTAAPEATHLFKGINLLNAFNAPVTTNQTTNEDAKSALVAAMKQSLIASYENFATILTNISEWRQKPKILITSNTAGFLDIARNVVVNLSRADIAMRSPKMPEAIFGENWRTAGDQTKFQKVFDIAEEIAKDVEFKKHLEAAQKKYEDATKALTDAGILLVVPAGQYMIENRYFPATWPKDERLKEFMTTSFFTKTPHVLVASGITLPEAGRTLADTVRSRHTPLNKHPNLLAAESVDVARAECFDAVTNKKTTEGFGGTPFAAELLGCEAALILGANPKLKPREVIALMKRFAVESNNREAKTFGLKQPDWLKSVQEATR